MAALSTIHFVHRSAAWVVLAVLLALGWRLRLVTGMQRAGQLLLALATLQLLTGVSNVVFDWPLLAAVLHTGGAAALVMTLTWALSISRSGVLSSDAAPTVVHSFTDSRPAA